MNVGIFNRVNNKGSTMDGMYGEWCSLPLEGGGPGVLGAVGGKEVVLAVMKQIAEVNPSPLTTETEVEWVLEVIRYGLSLPLTEHDAVRNCVRVCYSWLSALLPGAPPSQPAPAALPPPVAAAPKKYARKIFSHLLNLFVPRPNESADLIQKQTVQCHRVLRLVLSLAHSAELGACEWRGLLLLLLAAAAALLAPPAQHAAAAELCERVLCVLFEVWMLACHRCFPSPPLWRTLRTQCLRWRHRPALVEQWTRTSVCLTARLLKHMYGPLFPAMPISEQDVNLIPADMSPDAVMQSWYRILHTIGNPVDLCRPNIISQTPEFLQYSITQEDGARDQRNNQDKQEDGARDPSQHPCLQALPAIFHKAMTAISAHVDAFLGQGTSDWWIVTEREDTPPAHRRLAKSFSVSNAKRDKEKGMPRSSLMSLTSSRPATVVPITPPNSITSQVNENEKLPLTPLRPKVNSIFHLFGEWLFEAALIGTTPTYTTYPPRTESTPPPSSLSDTPLKPNFQSYQLGRAEALGCLCRIICSRAAREVVLAPYMARVCVALRRGLRDRSVAAAVVLHVHDVFRLDLDGVLVLVPDFIYALELILPEKEPKLECGSIDKIALRKAAISLLLSMVAFPYHYRGLPVPEFPGCNEYAGMTLGDLTRGSISLLCVQAVQVEWSDALAVPLLYALQLCVAHNAIDPGKADSVPPASTASHSYDYKARSEGSSGSDRHSFDEFSPDTLVRDLDPTSPVFGAALVVHATYLVCHRLISLWKGDLQVSLAALELLSELAKLHSSKPDALERKRAVRWICDYITVQCSRPPQAHSRDLHSCVVAAYNSLAAWLCPALLSDEACVATLLEVVELGLAGSKSQGKPGEPPKMKDEKELKPVSMRVRDAAESLLMLILEQSNRSRWCRLDERWLAALGHTKLRHFATDDGSILTLLEEPLANSQEPQPTLIVIIRTSWGRYAWSLCARGTARSGARGPTACIRPVDMRPAPPSVRAGVRPLCVAPPCATDAAFPSLDSVLRQLNDPDAVTLFKLLEQQAVIEKRVRESEDNNVTPEECTPPEPVTEFQTARLFLSNFGYLNISGEKNSGPRLTQLDSTSPALAASLRRLDACGPRRAITVHVFYVRAGRTGVQDILDNSRATDLPRSFIHLLRSLGSPVHVRSHPGWTGHVRTSYDATPASAAASSPASSPATSSAPTSAAPPSDPNTPAIYDGREQVLYWSDETTEMAFVVPSGAEAEDTEVFDDVIKSDVDGPCMSTRCSDKDTGSNWDVSNNSGAPSYERSISESDKERRGGLSDKTRTQSLDLDKQPAGSTLPGSDTDNRDYTTKILFVWLEDYEDHLNFPTDELLRHCGTGAWWRRSSVHVVWGGRLTRGLVRLTDDVHALVAPVRAADVLRARVRALAARAVAHDVPPPARRRRLLRQLRQGAAPVARQPDLVEGLFREPPSATASTPATR